MKKSNMKKLNMEEIGRRIRMIRKQKDLTQKDLAAMAGISPYTLNRVENNRDIKMLSIRSVLNLARALDVSVDYLLARTPGDQSLSKVLKLLKKIKSGENVGQQ